jgi:hypothetical protein
MPDIQTLVTTVPWTSDALSHMGAGVAVSFIDYALNKSINKKEDRIERKKECLESIATILDANGTTAEVEGQVQKIKPDSVAYAMNVNDVRDYLISTGYLKKESMPVTQKISGFWSELKTKGFIDSTGPKGKMLVTLGGEVLDNLVGGSFYANVMHQSPLGAWCRNVYQIPAFFIGLYVGKVLRSGLDVVAKPSEERKLDKAIKNAMYKTNVVDTVLNYQPTANVAKELESKGVSQYGSMLTGAGKKLYGKVTKGIGDAASAVVNFKGNQDAKYKGEKDKKIADFYKSIGKD